MNACEPRSALHPEQSDSHQPVSSEPCQIHGAEVIYDDVAALLALIERFFAGDTSRAAADEIEGLVLECFQGEPWFDEVSYALALYVPGGGDHYYDEVAVIRELESASTPLRAEWGESCG